LPPEKLRRLYQRAAAAAENSFRSLNQEILFRLKKSFDGEDARVTALHARWVAEALESGPPKPLKSRDLDAAFERGKQRAARRKAETSV
jgi:hypothetical protein